jgi:hypothetical protein
VPTETATAEHRLKRKGREQRGGLVAVDPSLLEAAAVHFPGAAAVLAEAG